MSAPTARRGRTLETGALAALLLFTLLAVGGYWNFALHPERIPASDFAARFFTVSFELFARLHIVVAAAALGVVLVRRIGLRWVPALAAVYLLSFLAEHVGTGYGFPFGGYGYTGLLGAKLGGRVPALIPLSWFLMALPSWVVARAATPASGRAVRILLASVLLVVWDLALDPAMSFLTPYWRWEDTGPYYGMPTVNLLGWFVTGLALMAALEALGRRTGLDTLPVGWMAAYYAVVLLMPLGMIVAAGLWPAVAATLAGVGGCAGVWALVRRTRRDSGSAPRPSVATLEAA